MAHFSTKVIDGFSTCFRQWRADSHCSYLHGYSLKFKIVFGADTLDANNWVMDFGFGKWPLNHYDGVPAEVMTFKDWFNWMFDHTTVIADDDPNKAMFEELHGVGVLDIRYLPHVGCEKFAEYVWSFLTTQLSNRKGFWVESVECIEHEKNSAIYQRNS